ncbi:hypothetical protein QQF64_036385 [Cirrhinus molitorella]|uniref:C2H2-type domain-containing protein n=1 Tax=Cirrhinus molitorella TaxID=172907 RepID=A0ABR3NJ29_9TELE
MNNSEERQIMLHLARGPVHLRDFRCPECSIVYNSVRRHFRSRHPELNAKQVKTHIRELQLMVSVDQLKKLRAQNPLVPMVSHLDRPEEEEEEKSHEECLHSPDKVYLHLWPDIWMCVVGQDWWHYGDRCQYKSSTQSSALTAVLASVAVFVFHAGGDGGQRGLCEETTEESAAG